MDLLGRMKAILVKGVAYQIDDQQAGRAFSLREIFSMEFTRAKI